MAASSTTSASSDNLDMIGAHVVVAWSKPDGQMCYLPSTEAKPAEAGHVTLDCHFCPSSNTALLRVRAPIQLKGLGRKTIPLFLFIAPERIQSLVYKDAEGTSASNTFRATLGDGDIASLRVSLRQAADLVVPSLDRLVPKKKASWDVLDSLKMLAQENDLVIYLRQDQLPSKNRLTQLSQAVSAGNLTVSTAHADISRLYDGKGGKLLEGEGLATAASGAVGSPPSYDELTPPPASPVEKEFSRPSQQEASASNSRKRRRTSSDAEESVTCDTAQAELSADTGRIEAICRKLVDQMTAKWREEGDQLRSELRQMETRMKDWVDERLSTHAVELREQIQRTSIQHQNQVYGLVQEASLELQEAREEAEATTERIEEVAEEMQAIRDDMTDVVDGRIDERLETLRGELEEYVTDQFQEVEGRVIDRLRANVFIDFNIYD